MSVRSSLLLLLLVACSASGQDLAQLGRCELFESSPQACQAALAGGLVWTAPALGVTQELLAAQMLTPRADTGGLSVLDAPPAMEYACARAYLALMCPTFFRPCAVLAPDVTVGLSMCRSACVFVNEACASFFGDTPLDCAQPDPLTGQPLWPEQSDTAVCLTLNASVVAEQQPEYPCPPPFVFAGEEGAAPPLPPLSCSPTCHTQLRLPYDNPQQDFDDCYVAFSVLSWISFVLTGLTIVIYSLFRENRKFPRRLTLLCGVGLFIIYLGFIGNTFIGLDDNLCASDIELQSGSSWCRFQAWTSFFGVLIVLGYWTYLAFTMFWNVALQRYKSLGVLLKTEPYVHATIWIYAFVTAQVLMWVPDEHQFGAFPGNIYCFYGYTTNMDIVWGLYWWPQILGMLVVILCCLAVVVRIAVTPHVGSRWSAMKKRLPAQLTVLVFLVVWMWTIGALITIQFYNTTHTDQSAAIFPDYLSCVFTTADMPQHCRQQAVDWRPNVGILWWVLMTSATAGTFFFFVYVVINPSSRRHFATMYQNYRQGLPILDGLTSKRMTTTMASSSPASRPSGAASSVSG